MRYAQLSDAGEILNIFEVEASNPAFSDFYELDETHDDARIGDFIDVSSGLLIAFEENDEDDEDGTTTGSDAVTLPTPPIVRRTIIDASVIAWAPAPSTTSIRFEGIGGGGGGGGLDTNNGSGGGLSTGGGGGGYFAVDSFTIDPTYDLIVGGGGAGGGATGTDGGAGGDTQITSATITAEALGGLGGLGDRANFDLVVIDGVKGGTATGGDINLPGSASTPAIKRFGEMSNMSISGSNLYNGGGVSAGVTGSETEQDATAPGGGGGGRHVRNTNANAGGGNGAAGVILITEYATP